MLFFFHRLRTDIISPCINYVHCQGRYVFPVRVCIPGEAHPYSWWGTFPFPVRINHSGMNILTGNWDVTHREWGCASPRMGMCLTRNARLHWEWGCASPRMHILTGNGICLTGNGMCLTRNAHPHRECA